MEILSGLTPLFFFLTIAGTFAGIIFGAIPGMTATMAVADCLPLTRSLGLINGMALLLGHYVGGLSGGLVPAVLLNIPGTPSSITTTFDGDPMAQRGEGGRALKLGIASSLFCGLFSLLILYLFAPALADFAIRFSFVEKVLIIFLALTVMAALSGSMPVGNFSGVLCILICLIGACDVSDGGNSEFRLMFGFMEYGLDSGFSLQPVLFGLSAIPIKTEQGVPEGRTMTDVSNSRAVPFRLSDFRGQIVNLFRSASAGKFVGLQPGVGGSAASVLSYSQAKALSKTPEKMGHGAPAGIIASETSKQRPDGWRADPALVVAHSRRQRDRDPVGAFTLEGIQGGPLFIGQNAEIWNMMIVAMPFANLAMFGILFYAIRHIAKVVSVPKHLLFPVILMMCVVGSSTINYGITFDVWTLLIFGVAGYLFHKIGPAVAPFIFDFIPGPAAEIYFVKNLESCGNLAVFVTKSWIAVALWLLIAVSTWFSVFMAKRSRLATALPAPDAPS